MPTTLADLTAAARQLPREEQLQLAETLLQPLADDDELTVEQCWILEAERRWDRVQRGEAELVDGPAALAALKARLQ
ncbi:MAG: addiction module protein [Planctomycetaceae bacterium]|nr:addiction module protein [Planctomycetaceae bacterium]